MGIEQVTEAAEAYAAEQVSAAVAPLTSQITYLETEKAALNQRIANLTVDLQNAVSSGMAKDQEILRLSTEILRLRALLAASLRTVYGCSRPDLTFGATLRQVDGYRTYLNASQTPGAVASDAGLKRAEIWLDNNAQSVLWLSVKAKPGAWLDSLMTSIETVFDLERLFITSRHEPYDDLYATGAAGIRTYHEHNDALEALLPKHSERWEAWTIWESYRRPSNTAGYYDAMLRPNQKMAFDVYTMPIDHPKAYDVTPQLDECLAYAQDHGTERPAIAEIGSAKMDNDPSGVGRSDWVADTLVPQVAPAWDTVLWFNQNAHQLDSATLDTFLGAGA